MFEERTEVVDRSQELIVRAPAKINVIIRVLDRLANGYHQLWSLMHTVDLFDVLRIRLTPVPGQIVLRCGDAQLPNDRRNLVYRAAEIVLQRCEVDAGVEIELAKSIPMAAGLGGGSSDAAATIWGVSRLLNLSWSESELCACASSLGSDIPFFFNAPIALVRGWGQEVTRFQIQGERWVVLVNPGFPIQTKWAYDQLAAHRATIAPLSEWVRSVEAAGSVKWDELVVVMGNDFESALFPRYPILEFITTRLRSLGAQGSLLSGSGATVFGIFEDKDTAQAASVRLRQETTWSVFSIPMGRSCFPHTSLDV